MMRSWVQRSVAVAGLGVALLGWSAAGSAQEAGQTAFFPKPDPANFTASSPSREAVETFLKDEFGYDKNRIWQVQAIWKTPAEGLSEVLVFVADKSDPGSTRVMVFFVTPDGKHFVQSSFGVDLAPFGAEARAEVRKSLQVRADGPWRGAESKNFEIVELADYQCPFCKLQHADLETMLKEFPQAHYVFQPIPLNYIHGASAEAAAYGYCVAKLGGNDAFFRYTDAVFENQDDLNAPQRAGGALAAAAGKAGVDPAKSSACAASAEAREQVEAWNRLAQDLSVHVPSISINGRLLPEGHYPYERLREIIADQMKRDGVRQ